MKHSIFLTVNGRKYMVEVESDETLLSLLRDKLYLTGTKCGCSEGECGACTAIVDGIAVRTCLVLAVEVDGSEIITIEGIAKDGELSRVQRAFIESGAIQCGFCTPGFVVALEAALRQNPEASKEELLEALGGHLCRCTGYESIIKAVEKVAYNKERHYR